MEPGPVLLFHHIRRCHSQLQQPRRRHCRHVPAHTHLSGEHGQKQNQRQIVGNGHTALEDKVLQGLHQRYQQVCRADHRQRQGHHPHIGPQLRRLLRRSVPQGLHQGGVGRADPHRRHRRTDQYGDGQQISGSFVALFPAAAETGGEDGDGGDAQGVSRGSEEIDAVVIGGGVQVRRRQGAERTGLQSLPDNTQQLCRQRDQRHGPDEIQSLISFHFDCSINIRISSSF